MPVTRALVLTPVPAPYRVPLFNALSESGDVDLEVWFFAGSSPDHLWQDPSPHARFRSRTLRGLAVARLYQGMPLYVNPALVPRLATRAFDVLVCGGYDHPSFWGALATARLRRKRTLLWTESTAGDHRAGRTLVEAWKRRLVRGFDGFIVPGSTPDAYLATLARPGAPVWISPNVVDAATFAGVARDPAARHAGRARFRIPPDAQVVLFVGRLIPEKGIGDLLVAAQSLGGEPRVRLLVVGTGPDARRYREEAAARGIPADFPGFLQQDELRHAYAAADVFAFPTRSDPWGLVLNEAVAAGLPVVVSRAAGAAADLVRDGENGFLVPPGDVPALAAGLRGALHPARRHAMGAASLRMAGAFSLDRALVGFRDALQGVRPSHTVGRVGEP